MSSDKIKMERYPNNLYGDLNVVGDIKMWSDNINLNRDPKVVTRCETELRKNWDRFKRINIHSSSLNNDFAEIEYQVFDKYRTNPDLQSALEGRKSLTKRLEELEGECPVDSNLYPRIFDEVQNRHVEILGQIIPTQHLLKRGLLAIDNTFSTMLAGMGVSLSVLFPIYFATDFIFQFSPHTKELLLPGIVGVSGFLSSRFAKHSHEKFRSYYCYAKARESALLVEEKIKELYYVRFE